MTARNEAIRLDLHAFDRRVHETCGAASRALFRQHVPRLERLTHFHPDTAVLDPAAERKAEFARRSEPLGIEGVSGIVEIGEDFGEILPTEMRQHEAVMQRRAPADQL